MGTPCHGLNRLAANGEVRSPSTIPARLALRARFVSAAADRFGLQGAADTNNLIWGNCDAYTQYLRVRAPYFAAGLLDVAAWGATAGRSCPRCCPVAGRDTVLKTALASAATLVVFACSMFFFSGLEATLSASVFSAAAAALLLALCPPGSDVVSIDHLRRSRRPNRKQ